MVAQRGHGAEVAPSKLAIRSVPSRSGSTTSARSANGPVGRRSRPTDQPRWRSARSSGSDRFAQDFRLRKALLADTGSKALGLLFVAVHACLARDSTRAGQRIGATSVSPRPPAARHHRQRVAAATQPRRELRRSCHLKGRLRVAQRLGFHMLGRGVARDGRARVLTRGGRHAVSPAGTRVVGLDVLGGACRYGPGGGDAGLGVRADDGRPGGDIGRNGGVAELRIRHGGVGANLRELGRGR